MSQSIYIKQFRVICSASHQKVISFGLEKCCYHNDENLAGAHSLGYSGRSSNVCNARRMSEATCWARFLTGCDRNDHLNVIYPSKVRSPAFMRKHPFRLRRDYEVESFAFLLLNRLDQLLTLLLTL